MTATHNAELRSKPSAWRPQGTGQPARYARINWIDALRGAALLGMAAYHLVWDLHAFGRSAVDPSADPLWRSFGHAVAATFLALSGVGMSLAARRGEPRQRAVRRLVRIAAAAGLVTLVTWVVAPEAPVWFGILHCIVVTNAIVLAFERAPTANLMIAAILAGVVPFALVLPLGPAWAWIGLSAEQPASLDFRPVLPWLCPVILGVVVGRRLFLTYPATWRERWSSPAFAWAGRHSLALYLGHQPVLIGILVALFGMPPREDVSSVLAQPGQAAAFLQQCRTRCVSAGSDAGLCASTCHCALTAAANPGNPSGRAILPSPKSTADRLADSVAACRSSSSRSDSQIR